ncbi:MAG TPA: glycosyltransferase family A protein [Dongiaceae bacterium]|nr:glycosyltransferase family A protein [Dongiaceae bacterium]
MALSTPISAVVPARNEEAVIAACVRSLAAQPEIAEIVVVNDQSSDSTGQVLRSLACELPQLRVLDAPPPPAGWVGKNHAVWLGAQEATQPWILFTDADAVLSAGAAARALQLAQEHDAALLSFSPEQVLGSWYEKALVPFVYVRLARKFRFEAVNDPKLPDAAANGQFLLIRRDAYDAVGGHAAVQAQVLEDVALARLVKAAGFPLWFAPGEGLVRVRMYRSFSAMWEGWKKNLFQLMGGTTGALFAEFESTFPWMILVVLAIGIKVPVAVFAGVVLLLLRQLSYGLALSRNHFPFKLIIYYLPAVFLYAGALWASHESYAKGKVAWKGREYPVGVGGASK